MVVSVGESSNNEQGVLPGPAGPGFCPDGVEQQQSRSMPTVLAAAQEPGALEQQKNQAREQAAAPLPSSWTFVNAGSNSSKEMLDVSMNAWQPGSRSSFLQQILALPPKSFPFPSSQPYFSLDGSSSSGTSSTCFSRAASEDQSSNRSVLSMRTMPPDKLPGVKDSPASSLQQRRDDPASVTRSGKMTSLGASPKCNVCSHKPNEARVVTFCGHLFCWPCLCCWLHNKSPNKECPVCNRPLTKNHITPLHGRQNSLTVARLQGMLRTEKTTPRTHSGTRGEGGRRQSKVAPAAASAGSAADKRSTSSVDDSIKRLLSKQIPCSFSPASSVPLSSLAGSGAAAAAVGLQDPALPTTHQPAWTNSRLVSSARPSSMLLQEHFTSVSTPTVVSMTPVPLVDRPATNNSPESVKEVPEEMKELGVLLSLEWEGAMSAIENAWWGAVSDVLNRNEVADDTPQLMTALSKEKEKIIHDLASEPLEGSQWLSARLDSFKTMASEELQDVEPAKHEESLEDWLMSSPDDKFEDLFPEFSSHENTEDEENSNQHSSSWVEVDESAAHSSQTKRFKLDQEGTSLLLS